MIPVAILGDEMYSWRISDRANKLRISILVGGDAQIVEGTGISAAVCRRYALSLPISTLAVGIESEENLNQDLEIARTFQPMNDLEKQAVLDQVEEHAGDGRYEWFKTTQYYDAKTHRLQHGFSVDA